MRMPAESFNEFLLLTGLYGLRILSKIKPSETEAAERQPDPTWT
jgi:hypothetical protein